MSKVQISESTLDNLQRNIRSLQQTQPNYSVVNPISGTDVVYQRTMSDWDSVVNDLVATNSYDSQWEAITFDSSAGVNGIVTLPLLSSSMVRIPKSIILMWHGIITNSQETDVTSFKKQVGDYYFLNTDIPQVDGVEQFSILNYLKLRPVLTPSSETTASCTFYTERISYFNNLKQDFSLDYSPKYASLVTTNFCSGEDTSYPHINTNQSYESYNHVYNFTINQLLLDMQFTYSSNRIVPRGDYIMIFEY